MESIAQPRWAAGARPGAGEAESGAAFSSAEADTSGADNRPTRAAYDSSHARRAGVDHNTSRSSQPLIAATRVGSVTITGASRRTQSTTW